MPIAAIRRLYRGHANLIGMAAIALAMLGALAWLTGAPAEAHPPSGDLAIVAPVRDCATLTQVDLAQAVGAATTIKASMIDTPKGQFCHVTGTIASAVGFEVDLPVAKWTQRFLQAGCGGLCGSINASIGNAYGCQPALDGQFVVAASDLGHQGQMGSPTEGAFAADPQKRIDFAYRGNHVTALAAKALIRAYYGQAPRYSYFSGCSDGGREALMEAQRFPDDFDGISAGDPAMLFQVQNSFYHAWTTAANLRAAGTPILSAAKLPVLHAAVIAHCDALDGTTDGLLTDPRLCRVDPAWVRCAASASDTAGCLTDEEWQAAERLYEGPSDKEGHRFLPGGLQPGSEMQWMFVGRGGAPAGGPGGGRGPGGPGGGMIRNMAPVVYRDPQPEDAVAARFPFTTARFARVAALHALNDATDPDLAPFARHGGRLILYHGWSDSSIAPMISVAYYEAVRRLMGAAADQTLRLFMLPGMGHCGGGDGFSQLDTLTPLMAWVEHGTAPAQIVADKVAERRMGPGGPPPGGGADGRRGPPPAGMTFGPANGSDGRSGPGGPGASREPAPYARPAQPALASRPILPYPAIAGYSGSGDAAVAASYRPVQTVAPPTLPNWYGASMIAPGYMRNFTVRQGALVEEPR